MGGQGLTLLMMPWLSTSGGMCVTVPVVFVSILLVTSMSRASPKSDTLAQNPCGLAEYDVSSTLPASMGPVGERQCTIAAPARRLLHCCIGGNVNKRVILKITGFPFAYVESKQQSVQTSAYRQQGTCGCRT